MESSPVESMESFPLSLELFRYLRKHRLNLQTRYHLKIFLPEVFDHISGTHGRIGGKKKNMQVFKDFLAAKISSDQDKQYNGTVTVITLEDSDTDMPSPCENPMKKKKGKKRKCQTSDNSTILTTEEGATVVNSTALNGTIEPNNKRLRLNQPSIAEEFIPLNITSDIRGNRSVKLTGKKKNTVIIKDKRNTQGDPKRNILKQQVSGFCSPSSSSWLSRRKAPPSSTVTSNSVLENFSFRVPANEIETFKADTTITLDDSIDVIEDKQPNSVTVTSSSADVSSQRDDSIMILEESRYVEIEEDSFVVDTNPSTVTADDSVTVLDDSIVEIQVLGCEDQFTPAPSQSKALSKRKQKRNKFRNNQNSNGRNGVPQNEVLGFNGGQSNTVPDSGQPQKLAHTMHQIPVLINQVPRPTDVRLRPIVIDGSNIARGHGRADKTYSCRGIKISVDYFLRRGHTEIKVFVPHFRRFALHGPFPTTDPHILDELESSGHIVYSPGRKIEGKPVNCYDDRFIVQLATLNGGVILSNDNYRDIMDESEDFRKTIQERLLLYAFAGDVLMCPDDPLGRNGPRLNEFLAFPPE